MTKKKKNEKLLSLFPQHCTASGFESVIQKSIESNMSNGSSLPFKKVDSKLKLQKFLGFLRKTILTLLEFYLTSLIYKPQILDLKTEDSAM